MTSVQTVPKRSEVDPQDTWDLASLFADDRAWNDAFSAWEARIGEYERFRGHLGDDAATLARCFAFDYEMDRAGERLGCYAYLKMTEDTADSTYQGMISRFQNVASKAGQAASFIRPEIMAIDESRMDEFLDSDELSLYRLNLERLLRYQPHTLGDGEEKLLAMQSEMSDTANRVFRQLSNADFKFGDVENEDGQRVELTNSSFMTLLNSPRRDVRKSAFHQFYAEHKDHENTLSATLNGSIQRDVYYARARNYASSLEAALFPDKVPQTVYDNLINSVGEHLPGLYRYYDVRRRAMELDEIHHYDTYVPILSDLEVEHNWDQAVEVVLAAVAPLGDEYVEALAAGLSGRWCDRYENKGKQSGAFSSGTFDGDPYILMNYQPKVLNHVFTLAHEAGHSMHSYFSARHQPYEYYDYTIFVAEVASTFNEMLLSHHLLKRAGDNRRERAYLINREIDDIRGTVFRQTMFAEFEKITHEEVEAGQPLTLDRFKEIYRTLLEKYFGPDFSIDDELGLECFRIPHFYRAFYVYKYATGMSAAVALARRVLEGGAAECEAYLGFLRGGCSQDPLDLLRGAGVDMEQPEPVDTALSYFDSLVEELDQLLS